MILTLCSGATGQRCGSQMTTEQNGACGKDDLDSKNPRALVWLSGSNKPWQELLGAQPSELGKLKNIILAPEELITPNKQLGHILDQVKKANPDFLLIRTEPLLNWIKKWTSGTDDPREDFYTLYWYLGDKSESKLIDYALGQQKK